MYVAQAQGVAIFATDGSLISGPGLVFDVLPSLFASMGGIGVFVSFGFFVLMSIAALTSSISMLEGPVSFVVERHNVERKKATSIIGVVIFILSTIIITNFETLFGLVISISTVYGQPLIAMLCCVFVGWIWQRSGVLAEIKEGNDTVEHSLFWKIWPWYTKFICPSAIAIVFWHSL
jgi:NSS family neurotransmitter:Na+ symporter